MQVNSTLRELYLSKHAMTDTGVEWLCRMLRENTTLRCLNISWWVPLPLNCNYCRNSVSYFVNCLWDRESFGNAMILCPVYIGLFKVLITWYIFYDSNSLSRDGARHLSVLLQHNTPLTHLDISNNRIEDEGLVHISNVLANANRQLTK